MKPLIYFIAFTGIILTAPSCTPESIMQSPDGEQIIVSTGDDHSLRPDDDKD